MCGIYCVIGSKGPVEPEEFLKSLRLIKHRGPDSEGAVYGMLGDRHYALGHRRLSIIDVSESANQPMSSMDGSVIIVFNGEIYNYMRLRDQLCQAGMQFRTHSDTEVMLAAYTYWGTGFLERLNGMFSFVLVDKRENRVIIGRDPVGIKPLYLYQNADGMMVSSEMKPIIMSQGFAEELSREAFEEYLLNGYITAPLTIYQNVSKVMPGTAMIFSNGNSSAYKYWEPRVPGILGKDTESDATDRFEKAICNSVDRHMISDVPIGCLLSGGKDSSLTAAIMQRVSKKPVDTITIGFDDYIGDERVFAREVAAAIGTRHHEVMMPSGALIDELSDFVDYFDEPFADESALPLMYLCKAAKPLATVMLTGDGSDELFGGYRTYGHIEKLENTYRRLGIFRSILTNERLNHCLGRLDWRLFAYAGVKNCEDLSTFTSRVDRSLLKRALRKPLAELPEKPHESGTAVQLRQMMDLTGYLPDNGMVKADRASMKYGVELRVPFLDREVMEFALSTPYARFDVSRGRKVLIENVLGRMLPTVDFNRPKQGFTVPLQRWLAHDLVLLREACVDPVFLREQGLFTPELGGQIKAFIDRGGYQTKLAWRILVFQLWYKRYMMKRRSH